MDANTFDPDLIHAIYKLRWSRRSLERKKNEEAQPLEGKIQARTSRKSRPTAGLRSYLKISFNGRALILSTGAANANALKLSCELLQVFVAEAVRRAAATAEAEGVSKIELTHLERILPQLFLDF